MRLGNGKCEHLSDKQQVFKYYDKEKDLYFYTCRKCGGISTRKYKIVKEK